MIKLTETTTIHINAEQFVQKETLLVEKGALKASLFCFESGVQAVRLANEVGHLILLPYQGQQIWRAVMQGRDLTMHTIFDQRFYCEIKAGYMNATEAGLEKEKIDRIAGRAKG